MMNLIKRPYKRPRKRIYYSVGMISLLMLPLLGFLFIRTSPRFKKQHVLEINMFVRDNPFGLELPLKQKQIEIRMTGDPYRDSLVLITSRWTIREFKQSRDTSKVIHFYFEEDAPYWTFVQVIDLCKRERAYNFIPFENHIWIVNRPRKKLNIDDLRAENIRPMVCGYRSCGTKITPKKIKENKMMFIKENAGILWPASLIFMLMIFTSIWKSRSTDPNK